MEGAAIDPLTGDFLFSTYDGGNLIVRVSVVPEPATWALLAIGLAILSVIARRRHLARCFASCSGPRSPVLCWLESNP
jgi:hypothetical protein